MLTVKEAYGMLLCPKEVVITLDGRNYTLMAEKQQSPDEIMMEHFKDYIVRDVQACEEDCFAFDILMKPVKREDM